MNVVAHYQLGEIHGELARAVFLFHSCCHIIDSLLFYLVSTARLVQLGESSVYVSVCWRGIRERHHSP